MTSSTCRPRWPEELGACPRCLSDATDAGQPLTWNRHWMNPLATVCGIHGTWLIPVATRMLARVHHVEDFGGVVQYVEMAQALLDCELSCAGDALWLQDLHHAWTNVRLAWGSTRPNDLTRIVDGLARTLIAESNSDDSACGPTANRRALAVKGFAFEPTAAQRAGDVVANPAAATPMASWPESPTSCEGHPRRGRFIRPGRRHQSSSWHRCTMARKSARLGVPQSSRVGPATG